MSPSCSSLATLVFASGQLMPKKILTKKEQQQKKQAQKAKSKPNVNAPRKVKDNEDPFPRFTSTLHHLQAGPADVINNDNATQFSQRNDEILDALKRQELIKQRRSALESRFIKLRPEVVEHYKSVLSKKPFDRPVQPDQGYLREDESSDKGWGHEAGNDKEVDLVCPKRPKWKYYMTKKEVEKNESVMFEKWLAETDRKLKKAEDLERFKVMGYFERNLDVWRQLWRVTEASDILLILLDVRCPLLHFPPSIRDYLATLKPKKPSILVLTKIDLVPRAVAESWKHFLEQAYGYPVVMVESYQKHERGAKTQGSRQRFDPGASPTVRRNLIAVLKATHESMLAPPPWVKEEYTATYRPKRLKLSVNWEDLQKTQSQPLKAFEEERDDTDTTLGILLTKAEAKKARRNERFDALENSVAKERKLGALRRKHPPSMEDRTEDVRCGKDDGPVLDIDDEEEHSGQLKSEEGEGGTVKRQRTMDSIAAQEPAYLSVGLIGQPKYVLPPTFDDVANTPLWLRIISFSVGKSSLLNALLSKKVVRASRTPGKTKSLQTIFWTKELRLVDCPGLVFPSFVGMEKQVMSGVIPVQNVESVIYQMGQHMPLEKVLNIPQPTARNFAEDGSSGGGWSTDSLLSTFALDRGFLTAKAARPDVYRAGSMIIRAFQASQIPWSYRPDPAQSWSSDSQTLDMRARKVASRFEGIWIADFDVHTHNANLSVEADPRLEETATEYDDTDSEEDNEESNSELESGDAEEDASSIAQNGDGKSTRSTVQSAFTLLTVQDSAEDQDDDGDSEEEVVADTASSSEEHE